MRDSREVDTTRYVAVIGPRACSNAEYQLAIEVGTRLAERGATVLCGGLGGVMEAAARGAAQADPPGASIGILPGRDRADGNEFLTFALATALGEARNQVLVASADAVIAVGGSPGTLIEMAHALASGRRVAVLSGWSVFDGDRKAVDGFESVSSAQAAVDFVLAKGHNVLARGHTSSPNTTSSQRSVR